MFIVWYHFSIVCELDYGFLMLNTCVFPQRKLQVTEKVITNRSEHFIFFCLPTFKHLYPPSLKARGLKIHKKVTHSYQRTKNLQKNCTWICRKVVLTVLRVRFGDLRCSCFVLVSHQHSLTASWSWVQEATWRICPQTKGDFLHATDCLLPLHQLIRADNFPIHTVLWTCIHDQNTVRRYSHPNTSDPHKHAFFCNLYILLPQLLCWCCSIVVYL